MPGKMACPKSNCNGTMKYDHANADGDVYECRSCGHSSVMPMDHVSEFEPGDVPGV